MIGLQWSSVTEKCLEAFAEEEEPVSTIWPLRTNMAVHLAFSN
jgi:hypothetical protein